MSVEKIKQLREMTGAGMLDVKKALDNSNGDIDKAVEWLRKQGISKAAKKADNIAAEGVVLSIISDDKKSGVLVEINSQTDFVAKNEDFMNFSKKLAHSILNSKFSNNDSPDKLRKELSFDGMKLEEHEIALTSKIGEKIVFRRFVKFSDREVSGYTHTNHRVAVLLSGENLPEILMKDIAMHAAAMAPKYLKREDVGQEYIDKETEIIREQYSKSMADKPPQILENIIKGAVNKQIAENILEEQFFVKDPSKKIKDLIKDGKLNHYARFEVGEGIEKQANDFAEEVRKAVNA